MEVEQRGADVTLRNQGEAPEDTDTVLLQRSRRNVGAPLVHGWHGQQLATVSVAILPTDARAGSPDPQGVLALGYFKVRGNACKDCLCCARSLSARHGVLISVTGFLLRLSRDPTRSVLRE